MTDLLDTDMMNLRGRSFWQGAVFALAHVYSSVHFLRVHFLRA
jgi:hypothetical protein